MYNNRIYTLILCPFVVTMQLCIDFELVNATDLAKDLPSNRKIEL